MGISAPCRKFSPDERDGNPNTDRIRETGSSLCEEFHILVRSNEIPGPIDERFMDQADSRSEPREFGRQFGDGALLERWIAHQIFVVCKGPWNCEWVCKKVGLACQILSMALKQDTEVFRTHQEYGISFITERPVNPARGVVRSVDSPMRQHGAGAVVYEFADFDTRRKGTVFKKTLVKVFRENRAATVRMANEKRESCGLIAHMSKLFPFPGVFQETNP